MSSEVSNKNWGLIIFARKIIAFLVDQVRKFHRKMDVDQTFECSFSQYFIMYFSAIFLVTLSMHMWTSKNII